MLVRMDLNIPKITHLLMAVVGETTILPNRLSSMTNVVFVSVLAATTARARSEKRLSKSSFHDAHDISGGAHEALREPLTEDNFTISPVDSQRASNTSQLQP